MKVSILVTYYNQAMYVDDSMRHIFELKSDTDYEIIVGDDGSTDNTLREVMKWKKQFGYRMKIVQMDRDDGITDSVVRVSNLRKKLLQESTGELFCILDGDDYYCDKNFISDAVKLFEKNKNISVVMHNYMKIFANGTKEEYKILEDEGILKCEKYIENYYTPAGACVFRKYMNDESQKRLSESIYYDDNDITLYNLNFGYIWYINKCVYMYRQNEKSIWNSLTRAQQGALNVLGADAEAYLVPEYENEIYYRCRRDILYMFFRKESPQESLGMDYYRKCLRLSKQLKGGVSNCVLDYDNASLSSKEKLNMIISFLKERDSELYSNVANNVNYERKGKVVQSNH